MKRVIIMGLTLIFCAEAMAQTNAFHSQTFDYRAPAPFLWLEMMKPTESFVIEQNCQSFGLDDTGPEAGRNVLEIGFRAPVPQRLPAEGQWYTRYTCTRPRAQP